MKVTEHRRGRSFLATLTSALLVASGLALAPTAALAAPDAAVSATDTSQGSVAGATLDWGVRDSFRNYLYNIQPQVFKGKTTLLGSTGQAVPKGTFQWSGGQGSAALDGGSADVSFGAGNGVRFQSHPMQVDEQEVYSLDMTFTNPRVVVVSPTTGQLRMDVEGFEFVDMTSVGESYRIPNAHMADLKLSSPTRDDDVLTWSGAEATLTEEGETAFGGFYQAGSVLDPVTFSLPVTAPVAATETTTDLSVSATGVTVGDEVTLSATVSPAAAAGEVQFVASEKALGLPVAVEGGVAKLTTKDLQVGKQTITAVFTPADAKLYASSTSAAVDIDVAKPQREPVSVSVSKEAGLNPEGETVTVTGSGFLPNAPETNGVRPPLMGEFGGVYVSFGSFAEKWQPSAGAKGAARVGFDTKWAVPAADMLTIGGPEKGAIALNADGTFTTELTLSKDDKQALEGGRYGVYTYSGSGASYDGFETYTPIAFAVPAEDTTVKVAVSADSVLSGDQVTLTATVSKGVAGSVQFFNGDAEIGEPVEVAADKAVLKTNALEAVGKNEITAVFTPANADAYNVSTSAPVTVEVAERPVPKVTVSKTEGIDPAGETVTVTGSGFLPKAPITNGKYDPFPGKFTGTYIVFGSFAENWQPSADVASSARKSFDTKWAVQAAELPTIAAMGGIELNADGTFETELKLSKDSAKALADGNYGVYTYAAGGAKYAPFETYTPIEFAPAAATTVTIEASPTDVYVGDEVEVTASVSEGISGSVQFSNNGKALGKPVKVTDGNATLKTSALVTGENSITAHFVPDNGDLFAASSSDAAVVTAAAQPTIEINGKPAGETVRIVAGDTLLLKAGQFTADQEFSVEIHSKVVKLPGTFVADSDGFVTAEWVLPDGFEAGKHSIVLTAADTGRVFTFDDAFTVEKKAVIDGGNGNEGGKNPDGGTGPDSDKGKGAGSVDKGTSQKDAAKDTGAKGLAASGSNPATGMIALTGAMLLIGAALVVIRRRQMSSAE